MSSNNRESVVCDVVEQFQDDDVLSGTGSRTNNHKGNQYFCDFMKKEYFSKLHHHHSIFDKSKVSKAAIEAVVRNGGRFLRLENGRWLVIKDEKKINKMARNVLEYVIHLLTSSFNVTVNWEAVAKKKLGIALEKDKKPPTVLKINNDSVLFDKGVHIGDQLIKIDGVDVSKRTALEVALLIKLNNNKISMFKFQRERCKGIGNPPKVTVTSNSTTQETAASIIRTDNNTEIRDDDNTMKVASATLAAAIPTDTPTENRDDDNTTKVASASAAAAIPTDTPTENRDDDNTSKVASASAAAAIPTTIEIIDNHKTMNVATTAPAAAIAIDTNTEISNDDNTIMKVATATSAAAIPTNTTIIEIRDDDNPMNVAKAASAAAMPTDSNTEISNDDKK